MTHPINLPPSKRELIAMASEDARIRHEAVEREAEAMHSLNRARNLYEAAGISLDADLDMLAAVARAERAHPMSELPGVVQNDAGEWVPDPLDLGDL